MIIQSNIDCFIIIATKHINIIQIISIIVNIYIIQQTNQYLIAFDINFN